MKRRRTQRGSISLEMALVLPLVLVICCYFLNQIRSQQVRAMMQQAVDQTARELALLLPAADYLTQATGLADQLGELNQVLKAWIPDLALAGCLEDALVDGASSVLLNRLLEQRLDYWLFEAAAGQQVNLPRIERQTALIWEDAHAAGYLISRYTCRTPLATIQSQVEAAVPLWLPFGFQPAGTAASPTAEEEADDRIWECDNFSRGLFFRRKYGANLPANFPVIAALNGQEAVMIKSVDLTAPSYRDPSDFQQLIARHAARLQAFRGGSTIVVKPPVTVTADQIQARRLLVVVPRNIPDNFDPAFMSQLHAEAQLYGVSLQLVQDGISRRFQDVGD